MEALVGGERGTSGADDNLQQTAAVSASLGLLLSIIGCQNQR